MVYKHLVVQDSNNEWPKYEARQYIDSVVEGEMYCRFYSGTSEIRTPWDLAKVSLFWRCP